MKTTLPIVLVLLTWSAGFVHALDLNFAAPMPVSHRQFSLADEEVLFPPLPNRNVNSFLPGAPFHGQDPIPMPGLAVTIQSATTPQAVRHGTVTIPITVTLTNQSTCRLCFLDLPLSHLWLYSVRPAAPSPSDTDPGKSWVQVNLSKPGQAKSKNTWIEPGRTCVLLGSRLVKLNQKVDTHLVAEVTVNAVLPNNAYMLLHTFSTPYSIPYNQAQPAVQGSH